MSNDIFKNFLQESVEETTNVLALSEDATHDSLTGNVFVDLMEDILDEAVIDGQDIEVPVADANIDSLQFFNQDNVGSASTDDSIFDPLNQPDHGNSFQTKDSHKRAMGLPMAGGQDDELSEDIFERDIFVTEETTNVADDTDFSDDDIDDDLDDEDDYIE